MAGQKFQSDKDGTAFLCFVIPVVIFILIPSTCYFWPNPKPVDTSSIRRNCANYQDSLAKRRIAERWERVRKLKQFFIRAAIIFGWLLCALFLYELIQREYDDSFDPYKILGVDPSATLGEINKAYRKLSLIYHPDKPGGNEKLFMRLTRAHQALTDATARRNLEMHRNPNGPQITFGLAYWLMEEGNSAWALGLYLVLLFGFPIAVVMLTVPFS